MDAAISRTTGPRRKHRALRLPLQLPSPRRQHPQLRHKTEMDAAISRSTGPRRKRRALRLPLRLPSPRRHHPRHRRRTEMDAAISRSTGPQPQAPRAAPAASAPQTRAAPEQNGRGAATPRAQDAAPAAQDRAAARGGRNDNAGNQKAAGDNKDKGGRGPK